MSWNPVKINKNILQMDILWGLNQKDYHFMNSKISLLWGMCHIHWNPSSFIEFNFTENFLPFQYLESLQKKKQGNFLHGQTAIGQRGIVLT